MDSTTIAAMMDGPMIAAAMDAPMIAAVTDGPMIAAVMHVPMLKGSGMIAGNATDELLIVPRVDSSRLQLVFQER
jgi:hypothetical protein